MSDKSDLWKTLQQFFDNPENAKPDIKALAAVLRSDAPLPDGFRDVLAEIFDSRLPGPLACNWRLKPQYAGLYDKELKIEKEEKVVEQVIRREAARGVSITKSMSTAADAAGISTSTAWQKTWKSIQMKRATREKFADAVRHITEQIAAKNSPKR
jgi:hypothetical protein